MPATEFQDALAAPFAVGATTPLCVGEWELTHLIAEGNFSRVYRARPAGSSPEVPGCYAVKVLRPELEEDRQAVALLCQEARVGRGVRHPRVVSILQASVGRAPRYLVMPHLEGATLRGQLDAGGPIDLPAALWFVRQVAEGLEAMHTAGWVHGDIKPGNIHLSPEGHATLLDLAFARRADQPCSVLDQCIAGTAPYLAPELFTSALRSDIRSDLYSLGVVLYELLAGQLPLFGGSLAELAEQHRETRPTPLRQVVPQVAEPAAALVHRMLAKDPMRRFQTPRELIDQLMRLEIETFSHRTLG